MNSTAPSPGSGKSPRRWIKSSRCNCPRGRASPRAPSSPPNPNPNPNLGCARRKIRACGDARPPGTAQPPPPRQSRRPVSGFCILHSSFCLPCPHRPPAQAEKWPVPGAAGGKRQLAYQAVLQPERQCDAALSLPCSGWGRLLRANTVRRLLLTAVRFVD